MATLNNQDVFNTVCELATVEFNGDVVTVRTRDLESFKTELVARHTKNASKKRQGDSRFDYLMVCFAKVARGQAYKRVKVYILGGEKINHGLRGGAKKQFLKAAVVFKDQFGSLWAEIDGVITRMKVVGDFVKCGRPVKVEEVVTEEVAMVA